MRIDKITFTKEEISQITELLNIRALYDISSQVSTGIKNVDILARNSSGKLTDIAVFYDNQDQESESNLFNELDCGNVTITGSEMELLIRIAHNTCEELKQEVEIDTQAIQSLVDYDVTFDMVGKLAPVAIDPTEQEPDDLTVTNLIATDIDGIQHRIVVF